MGRTFRIEGAALLYGALAILLLRVDWIAGLILAVAVHELCHYAAARWMKVSVFGITVGLWGCRLLTGVMDKRQEILVSAAGPAGSLSLLLFLRAFPPLALCGLVQGVCNLLPLYPLDGGRILKCLVPDRWYRFISAFTGTILTGLGVWAGYILKSPWILCLILWNCFVKSGYLKNSLQRSGSRCTIELPIFKR